MKKILNRLFEHQSLSYEEAKDILINIAKGTYNENELAAFMTVYLMRNITINELAGFRDALLELCLKIDLSDFNTIDLCGTGGDGKNTFNISTLTAFVVAGAGYKVAKHGNYGVSSVCGSSNVLEYFGYKFTNDIDKIKRNIDKAGICFLHAPMFHPAMKNIAPVRRSLKVKTFFNILGPLVNPSFPQNQMNGVFNLETARMYNYLLQNQDINYVIVYNLDGYDEISLTDDFKVITNFSDEILNPGYFKFDYLKQSEIEGGNTIEEAASIFKNVLEGKGTTAQNNVVLANASLAIKCIDKSKSLDNCLELAQSSIKDGKALKALKKIIEN